MKISKEEYDREEERGKYEVRSHIRLKQFYLREKRNFYHIIRFPKVSSLLYLFFFTPLFPTSSLNFTAPYLTSSILSLPHSTSIQFYSYHLSQPHISSPHLTTTPHRTVRPKLTPPHSTSLHLTSHLTSLLLCSALLANSTILCVSGFDDPSSARLE